MFNIFLSIIIVLSLAYIIWLLVKKFPYLSNVNVDSLPEIKLQKQKDKIVQDRLERIWLNLWKKIRENSGPWSKKFKQYLQDYYQKLKTIERDLRQRGAKEFSSAVNKSQTVDQLIASAELLIKNEDYASAEEKLLDALAYDQHNVPAYKLLAELYRYRKEYTQAKETLEYLLKLTHNADPTIYSSLANLAKQRGDLKQAEEGYLQSISLSASNDLYFLSLAEVYLELEEERQALATAQRALALSPNNPKILDFLIKISIIMHDKDLAIRYLDKMKEVNPDNQKIVEFLEQIDNLN